jgi:hypothetical protein
MLKKTESGGGPYSVFTSSLDRIRAAEWLFPFQGPQQLVFVAGVEVKAISHTESMAISEVKTLYQACHGSRLIASLRI